MLVALGAGAAFLVAVFVFTKTRPSAVKQNEFFRELALCYQGKKPQSRSPIFEVSGSSYALEDLPFNIQYQYSQAVGDGFRRQRSIFEDAALRIAIAKDKGIPVNSQQPLPEIDEMYPDEVKVTDDELKAFFEANKQSFPSSVDYEKLVPTLQTHLRLQKRNRLVVVLEEKFKQTNKIRWAFEPPCPVEVAAKTDNFEVARLGSKGASTNLIYFTSYFCPTCRAMWPKLVNLLKNKKARLTILPIIVSPKTNTADFEFAKATYCVAKHQNNQLLAFSDMSYRASMNLRDEVEKTKELITGEFAAALKMPPDQIKSCLESPEATKFAVDSLELTGKLAIKTAPAMIINNRPVLLAPTDDSWIHLIENL